VRAAALALAVALAAQLGAALAPAEASAAFGFRPGLAGLRAEVLAEGGIDAGAGIHPLSLELHFGLNESGGVPEGALRSLSLALPPGFLANSSAPAVCSAALFHTPRASPFEASQSAESCPDGTQVGVVRVDSVLGSRSFGVFNLEAPYGVAGAIGFAPFGVPVEMLLGVREPGATMTLGLSDLSQSLGLRSLDLSLWGVPADKGHDGERGNCLNETEPGASWGQCPVESAPAYLTLPSSCGSPLRFEATAGSWEGGSDTRLFAGGGSGGPPLSLGGCVAPKVIGKVQLQSEYAAAATGLVFNLEVNDGGGFRNPAGVVRSPIRDAVVSLPQGLTMNPSLGAGLGTCSAAQFAAEGPFTPPGGGCPNASKIGDVAIEGLLGLPEVVKGSLFLATPRSVGGALIGLYITVADPRHGLFSAASGRVIPDPATGQLTAHFEGLPQLHYTHFALRFREGQRAAMVSPPACGSYATAMAMTPYADPGQLVTDSSSFLINSGEAGASCPTGAGPFAPHLLGGMLNPQAGAYTPFYLRFWRSDAEQEFRSYSATLPPGLLGRIAGIPFCPDAAIAAAATKSGTDESAHPDCPVQSQIGHTTSGYGVGRVLAYAPGNLYLAGPYHGAPLSIVAIDSAVVGPFDLGTVVVRSAIRLDPRSAQVEIDSAGSDPIPHILAGIPLHLRDIRIYVDRPSFTVNPTSCRPMAITSLLGGAGADLASTADDTLANNSQRFQLANCSALGFRPRLALALGGGHRRARFPTLRTSVRMPAGGANIAAAQVTLPSSLFLEQAHLRAVCTRGELEADACPPASAYGTATARTPLLAEPLSGPVYLATGFGHRLPDLVVLLRGAGMRFILDGRIDSRAGGLRASFSGLPDAPVSEFSLTLRGGRHGILVNERDLCSAPQRASAVFTAQDNARSLFRPLISVAGCAKKRRHRRHRHGARKRGHGRHRAANNDWRKP
jgi:hypothetical protein